MGKNMTYADTAPAISTDDLTNAFGDEPRVRDLLLAERLGFKRLTDVRELIGRNKAELEWYGPLFRKEARVDRDPAAAEAILPCRTVKSGVKPRARDDATKTTQTAGATKTRQPKRPKPPIERERDVLKEPADKPDRRRRGRPTKDYWLNEGQAGRQLRHAPRAQPPIARHQRQPPSDAGADCPAQIRQ